MTRSLVIGKLWDSEYPWDVRVEKVCDALTSAGHRVELVCRNRDDRAPIEDHGLLRIHRMPFRRHWPRSIERLSSFPAFINPRWYRLARRVFEERRVDLILCRDLPLAPMALALGRRISRPVIVDVAEHYPGLLKDLYNVHDFRLANLLIRNPLLAAWVERTTLPRADGLWVVIDEMADRLVRMGVARDRISLVSNTPSLGRRKPGPPIRSGQDGVIRMVYLGIIEQSRGLGVVLSALAKLDRSGPIRATLDVFGDGHGLPLVRRRIAELGLGEQVTLHGRQPYEAVLSRLSDFDVGVIPHHATDHWNYTIQNKLFDYLAAGLPVIVSSMPPAARIVQETGAGVVFRDRDPGAFLESLAGLTRADDRNRMGRQGRMAVERTFNWSFDAARLVASVEGLASRGGELSAAATAGPDPGLQS